MAQIETDELIKLYYEEVKHLYPNIDLEHFTQICKNHFRFIASLMEKDDLPSIKVKYLGRFQVTSGRVANMIRDLDIKLKFNGIKEEDYKVLRLKYETKYKELLKIETDEKDLETDEEGD